MIGEESVSWLFFWQKELTAPALSPLLASASAPASYSVASRLLRRWLQLELILTKRENM